MTRKIPNVMGPGLLREQQSIAPLRRNVRTGARCDAKRLVS